MTDFIQNNPVVVLLIMSTIGVSVTIWVVYFMWQSVDRLVDARVKVAVADIQRRLDEMTARRESDQEESERLQDRLYMALGRVQRLEAQLIIAIDRLRAAGAATDLFERDPAEVAVPYINEAVLAREIGRVFSDEDVAALAFDLGIDVDNLPSSTKASRIRALVMTMRHHGRMSEFLKLLAERRPNEVWY